MKRIITFLIIGLLSIAASWADDVYTVNSSKRLNVRQSPSTSAAVVTQLSPGTSVTVISTEAGWAKVRLQGSRTGYVSTKYISYSHSISQSSAQTAPQKERLANRDLVAGIDLRHAKTTGWGIFWFVLLIVFTIAAYYLNFGFEMGEWEDEHFYLGIAALLGAALCVPITICTGFTIPVTGWISYILIILLMGAIAFAQVALYGRILGYYDGMTRGDEQERVGGLTLWGAGIIGVIRAICELCNWHFPDFLTSCFLIGISILSILIIIPGFKSDNYGAGLLMALIVVPVCTACFAFSVVVIVMATFGILIAILVLCALAMPSGSSGSSRSSESVEYIDTGSQQLRITYKDASGVQDEYGHWWERQSDGSYVRK